MNGLRDWWIYSRPWWVRAHLQHPNRAENNHFLYLGPFTFSWDHELSSYTPGVGFAWIPQPRRAFRIWFRVFTKLLEVKLWRDQRYCECGALREFCDDASQHRWRIERESRRSLSVLEETETT